MTNKSKRISRVCRHAAILMFGLGFLSSASFARDIGFAEDPLKIGVGARPMGMGKAFVAVADDENSLFVNPAGLSYVKDWTFTSMYTSFLGDVNYVALGFIYPSSFLKNGVSAIGYLSSSVPDIISPGQGGFSYSNYYNNVLLLSTSSVPYPNLAFGATLKYFSQGFSGAIDSAGTGVDLDLGAKWDIDRQLSLGLNLQNILPSSLGGNILWPNGDEQRVPPLANIGIKCETEDGKIIIGLDSDLELERKLPGTTHLGVEWKFHPQLSIRGGVDQSVDAVTGGTASNLTLGLGLKIGAIKLDYAYHPYFEETGNITHYISLSFSGPPFVQKTANVPTPEVMAVSTPEAAAVSPEAAPKPAQPAPVVVYEVRAGDTLGKIALKFYKVKNQDVIMKIARYNLIADPDKISIGQRIVIPK